MTVKLAHAYDTIAKQWIGRVPVEWFDNFPHLAHEGPDGERPDVERTPLGSMTIPALKGYARENKIDLGEAKKKADIIAAIADAEQVPGDPEQVPDPSELEVDVTPPGDDADDDGE